MIGLPAGGAERRAVETPGRCSKQPVRDLAPFLQRCGDKLAGLGQLLAAKEQ